MVDDTGADVVPGENLFFGLFILQHADIVDGKIYGRGSG